MMTLLIKSQPVDKVVPISLIVVVLFDQGIVIKNDPRSGTTSFMFGAQMPMVAQLSSQLVPNSMSEHNQNQILLPIFNNLNLVFRFCGNFRWEWELIGDSTLGHSLPPPPSNEN